MQVNLKINYQKMLINILKISIIVGCFGYMGVLYTYHVMVKYMAIMLIYAVFVLYSFKKYSLRLPVIWKSVWIYIIISTLFLNFPKSLRYLIVFTLGMVFLKLGNISENFFEELTYWIIGIGSFFSLGTLLQVISPSSFNSVLRLIQNENIYNQTLRYREQLNSLCGFAGESSFNAFCISIGVFCLIAQVFTSKKLNIFKISWIIIMYYTIYLTGKRSFLLIIPIVVFCFFLFHAIASNKKKHIILGLLVGIIMPVVLYFVLGETIIKILSTGKGRSTNAVIDLSNREMFWEIAFNMLRSKPFFGHGLMAYDNFYNIKFRHAYAFAGAHNSFFQLFSEMGCVGGILYIIAIVTTFIKGSKDTWKIIKQNNTKFKLLTYTSLYIQVLCICYGFSGNPFHRPQQLLTYFIAVAMGMYVHKNMETK